MREGKSKKEREKQGRNNIIYGKECWRSLAKIQQERRYKKTVKEVKNFSNMNKD
jgi:hypothetical protein